MNIGREIDVTGKTHTRFLMAAKPGQPGVVWLRYDLAVGLYPHAFVLEELKGSGAFRVEMHRGRKVASVPSHPVVPTLFVVSWSPWAEWSLMDGWKQGEGYTTEWDLSQYPTTSAEEGYHDTMTIILFATGNKEARVALMVATGS